MQGDFSRYPSPIREIFPYIYGEVTELHALWQTYHHLFMESEARTNSFGKYLGGIAGYFQSLLQDELILAIVRLTDRDSLSQKNLGLPSLCTACESWDAELGRALAPKLQALQTHVAAMRQHRHKRLAHYDLNTSIGADRLPMVTLGHIREAIEQMKQMVQLIVYRGEKTTILFGALDHRDISAVAEATIAKAAAYDKLVEAGKVERLTWRNSITRENPS